MESILFLPGLGKTADVWDKVIEKLPKDKVKPYKLDLVPFGSMYKGKRLNFDSWEDWLTDQIELLQIKKPFSIAGFSLGGYVTIKYTSKYSQNINKLVIVSTPLKRKTTKGPLLYRTLVRSANSSKVLKYSIRSVMLSLKKVMEKSKNERLQELHDIIQFGSMMDIDSVVACITDILAYDFQPDIEKIQNNILILHGTKDITSIKIHGTDLYENFKNKKVVSVNDNHSITLNSSDIVAEEIIRFFI